MNEELETAVKLVLADLEYNNNHTLGKLLNWAYYEDNLSNEQAFQAFQAWLVARDFLNYGKTCDNDFEEKGYLSWLEMRKEYA